MTQLAFEYGWRRSCGCPGKRHRFTCGAPPIVFATQCRHTSRRVCALGLCQPCYSTRLRRKQKEIDPLPFQLAGVRSRLKKRYGLTLAQYNDMLASQGGVCAICRRQCESGRNLAVDHDHRTGEVRGLLCRLCNQAIGQFRDNPITIWRALEYVARAVPTLATFQREAS